MSMPNVTLEEEEERGGDVFLDGVQSPANINSHGTQLGLNLEPPRNTPERSPSPSGLLSLPWEMVARIASHLPAQCVISVLPQVCRALGEVGEDASAWHLRAQRLTGAKASFPVGPRDHFDWPEACLEMEQLIERWAGQEERVEREVKKRAEQEMEEGRADGELEAQEEAIRQPDAARYEELRQPRAEEPQAEVEAEGPPERNGDREERAGGIVEEQGGANGVRNGQSDRERVEAARGEHQNDCVEPPDDVMDEGMDPPRAPKPAPPSPMEHITLPSGHIADVNAVLLVGGEGAVCASGSRDRNVNLWDLRQGPRGTLLRTLTAQGDFSTHRGWVWCLAASGPLLASGAFDSTVRLWDLGAGGAERSLIRSRAAVLCLSCQGDLLLAGSHDQKVTIYDTRAPEPLVKSLRLHGDAVLCLASDERYVLSGSKDNTVAVFDLRARKLLQKVQLKSYLLSMSYSGHEVWAGDNHGLIHTFSMNEGSFKSIGQFNVGHSSLVTGVHRSPGTLYTCSSDRTIKVHLPCAPPKTLCTLQHQAGVNGLSVEAGVLAIASGYMNVEVWRPRQ